MNSAEKKKLISIWSACNFQVYNSSIFLKLPNRLVNFLDGPFTYIFCIFCLVREQAIEDDSGIEGILNRLEKERNTNFGFGLREKGNTACVQSDGRKDDQHVETSKEEVNWFFYFQISFIYLSPYLFVKMSMLVNNLVGFSTLYLNILRITIFLVILELLDESITVFYLFLGKQ